MKIALYIEDGLEQIVLTPESETEDGILGKLHDGTRTLSIHRGEFYACRGGWMRWKKEYPSYGYSDPVNDKSTIIVLAQPKVPDHQSDFIEQAVGLPPKPTSEVGM